MRLIKDIKKYRKYIVYSAKAQLKSEVKNAYFDWLWWVLEPFGLMIVYAVVFGAILGTTEEYFAVFIFSGNAMWGFFSKSLTVSVRMIKNNEVTISKVYLPKMVLVLNEMMVNAYKMMINFAIVFFMLIVYRVPISWKIIYIIPIFIIFFVFVYACCVIAMHVGVFIADATYVITIGLNMMMYMSGLFYSFDRFGEPIRSILQNCNPIAFLITEMRKVVMYCQNPNHIGLLLWLIISLLMANLGTSLVYKNENNYVKVI